MKILSIVCILVAAITSAFGINSSMESKRLRMEIAQRSEALRATTSTTTTIRAEAESLAEKLAATTAVITNQTQHIASLYAQLEEFRSMADRLRSLSTNADVGERRTQWAGQVTPPETVITTDDDGRETKSFIFRKLTGIDGLSLGTNATFLRSYGRSLMFRMPSGTRAMFDIDQVHPGVLAHVGVDASESQRAQVALDEDRQRRLEREAVVGRMLSAQWREDARVRFEQAAKAAEINAQFAVANAQQNLATAESRKSVALEQAASAAILNASRPPVTVIQSQSQGIGY